MEKVQKNNVDNRVLALDYSELIIEMVHKINDKWILEQIYRCIKNITKED